MGDLDRVDIQKEHITGRGMSLEITNAKGTSRRADITFFGY